MRQQPHRGGLQDDGSARPVAHVPQQVLEIGRFRSAEHRGRHRNDLVPDPAARGADHSDAGLLGEPQHRLGHVRDGCLSVGPGDGDQVHRPARFAEVARGHHCGGLADIGDADGAHVAHRGGQGWRLFVDEYGDRAACDGRGDGVRAAGGMAGHRGEHGAGGDPVRVERHAGGDVRAVGGSPQHVVVLSGHEVAQLHGDPFECGVGRVVRHCREAARAGAPWAAWCCGADRGTHASGGRRRRRRLRSSARRSGGVGVGAAGRGGHARGVECRMPLPGTVAKIASRGRAARYGPFRAPRPRAPGARPRGRRKGAARSRPGAGTYSARRCVPWAECTGSKERAPSASVPPAAPVTR